MKAEEALHDSRYYRRLTQIMASIIAVVSLTPLLLISGISSSRFGAAFEEKVEAQLREMVQKHQQTIDLYLSEKLGELRLVSRSLDVNELRDSLSLETELKHLQEEFSGAFVDLGFVAPDGIQLAYAGPYALAHADYSDAGWFRQAMDQEFYISDVFLGLRGVPHFIIAVRQIWNGEPWILRATIDFMAFNALVENIRIGRTGSAYIINTSGTFQTGPRHEQPLDAQWFIKAHQEHVEETEGPTHPGSLRHPLRPYWASAFMPDRVSIFRHVDPQDVDTIYVSTPLKGGDWILVYRQDVADAFSELQRTRRIIFFIVGAGGITIILTAVFLAQWMVRGIRRADKQKEVMNDQIIEAGRMASLGELAAGIAHEINNPVAIMVEEAGWIGDLLGDEEKLENIQEEIERSVDQIQTQGIRCKEITHKLLSFARKLDPTPQALDLNALVSDLVGLSDQRSRCGNCKVMLDLSEDLPRMSASPSELQQVILNLVNNAVDAVGSDGGTVTVTTRQDGQDIVLLVRDSGAGIPQANLNRIFDPFFTTKPVGKGTGLGLSIVYGIVQKMGGEISVESTPNVGTEFMLRLPIGEPDEPSQPEHEQAGGAGTDQQDKERTS